MHACFLSDCFSRVGIVSTDFFLWFPKAVILVVGEA